ncbi:MAG: Threonine synthase [candidate division Zixibacteria bacterium RBG-1]|nr:MAG: Threonine synthase [candidate division Zixibacteria bacterium RBG-1]OGC84098.1 MAG: threonine synthase [candidate division Zixibacteria bacterium RBG_19FT_COMBO_42_43]
MSFLQNLQCTVCQKEYSKDQALNLCSCGGVLFAVYALKKIAQSFQKKSLAQRPKNLWRYAEFLPVENEGNIVSLGEGFTPIIELENLGKKLGLKNLYLKDESFNPTGSFKARGMSVAVSKAKELNIKKICLPSAGNAASAASCYAAKADLQAYVFMPKDVDFTFVLECRAFGAVVNLVDGLISDAGKMMNQQKQPDWFDLSTTKEPYRVEGKKTLGLELAEQLDWELPDVVIFPTGGGVGIIGMWKAFDEMEKVGLIGKKRPRMIAVQAEGCAPLVKAFREKKDRVEEWKNATTIASGLRVPKPFADFIVLKALKESKGEAIAVSDEEIVLSLKEMAQSEGIFPGPEGASSLAGLKKLMAEKKIDKDDKVALFNTGSALKHIETLKKFYS